MDLRSTSSQLRPYEWAPSAHDPPPWFLWVEIGRATCLVRIVPALKALCSQCQVACGAEGYPDSRLHSLGPATKKTAASHSGQCRRISILTRLCKDVSTVVDGAWPVIGGHAKRGYPTTWNRVASCKPGEYLLMQRSLMGRILGFSGVALNDMCHLLPVWVCGCVGCRGSALGV